MRIRVRGRLQDMIRAELGNLGKVESVLRCLALSMEYRPSDDLSRLTIRTWRRWLAICSSGRWWTWTFCTMAISRIPY